MTDIKGTYTLKIYRPLSALLLALWAAPAFSQAVPPWAVGRDGNNDLIIDAGVLGNLTFVSEYAGTEPNSGEHTGCAAPPRDRVAYDWSMDGYEGRMPPACRTRGACPNYEDDDLAHPVWKDEAIRNVLIKNWHIKNAFKTVDPPHVDVLQVYEGVRYGGWFVMQDSTFKNSDDGILQLQFGDSGVACSDYEGKSAQSVGGVIVQNVILHQETAFRDDCRARWPDEITDCLQGNHMGSWYGPNVGWFINYQTNGWRVTLQQSWDKVIVVGNVPDLDFRSDDSYAFSVTNPCSTPAHDACSFGNKVFGPYPSIEAALADGHAEPPFIRLSCSGWANVAHCAAAGGGAVPSAPSGLRAF